MENCYKHLDTPAVETCHQCKRSICETCQMTYNEEQFCSNFCVSQYKNSQRSQLYAQLTSTKTNLIYSGFFLLAAYLMYIVYRFQSGTITMNNLWPHAIAYMLLGLVLSIIFLVISLNKSDK